MFKILSLQEEKCDKMTIKGIKKKEKHAQLFKLWEKNRRDRFNCLLDQLSKKLPGHDSEVTWTKSQIVEQAIGYIERNCNSKATSDQTETALPEISQSAANQLSLLQKKCRLLETQNTKLRELIRSNLAEEVSKEKFRRMTVQKIFEHVALKKESQNQQISEELIISSDDPSDIFVTDISPPTDHSYSLIVQSEPEVEIVTIQEHEHKDETLSLISPNNYGTAVQPYTVYQTVPGTDLFSEIGTVNNILNHTQTMLVPILPQQKTTTKILPWPRPGVVQTVSIYQKPLLATSLVETPKEPVWKLPKKPRKKRSRNKKIVSSNATIDESKTDGCSNTAETIEKEKSVTQAADEILTVSKNEKVNEICEKKSDKESIKGEIKISKKSKNSYSIAALCQISVNIGGDPSLSAESLNVGVNSPGMVSLNSVGTTSPVPTPDPAPTPPALPQSLTSYKEASLTLKSSHSSPKTGLDESLVIEELQPPTHAISTAHVSERNDLIRTSQPLSPTKTFLTEFPVVKQKSQTRKGKRAHEKASTSQPLISDLSVFDFNDSKSDSEVFDLGSQKRCFPAIRADPCKFIENKDTTKSQQIVSNEVQPPSSFGLYGPSLPSTSMALQFYSPPSSGSGSSIYSNTSLPLTSSRSSSLSNTLTTSVALPAEPKQVSKSALNGLHQSTQLLSPLLQSVASMSPGIFSSQSLSSSANTFIQTMPVLSSSNSNQSQSLQNSPFSANVSASQLTNFPSIYTAAPIVNSTDLGTTQSLASSNTVKTNTTVGISTNVTTSSSSLPKQTSNINSSTSNQKLPSSTYAGFGTGIETPPKINIAEINLSNLTGTSSTASTSSKTPGSVHHPPISSYPSKISTSTVSASSHTYAPKTSTQNTNNGQLPGKSSASAYPSQSRYSTDYATPSNHHKTSNSHFHHFPYPYPNLPSQPGPNFHMQQAYHQPNHHHQTPLQQTQSDFSMQQSLHPTYHSGSYSLQTYNLPTVNLGPPPLGDLVERPLTSESYCFPQSESTKQTKSTSRNATDLIPQQSYFPPPPLPSNNYLTFSQPVLVIPQENMGSSGTMIESEQGSLFSVNQLVSTKSQSGSRKSSKRSLGSAASGSRSSKQNRFLDLTTSREAERDDTSTTKKTSSSKVSIARSSSYKSSSKRSYSAESLISNENIVLPLEPIGMEMDPKLSLHQQQTSYKASDFTWSLGDQGSSTQLMFPSVSPSPGSGSYFGSDLSDFTSALFATTEAIVSSPPNLPQTRSHYSQQVQKRSVVSTSGGGVNTSASTAPSNTNFLPIGSASDSDNTNCINHTIFDNFLLPSTSDDHISNCSNSSSVSANFLSNSMSLSIQAQQNPTQQHQSSSKQYYVNQVYQNKPNQNSGIGGGLEHRGSSSSQTIHHGDQGHHLILPPISSGGLGSNVGSAYVNFNLSTIFPEINVDKLPAHALLPSHPPHILTPAPIVSSSAMPGKIMSTVSAGGPPVDMRSISTPDILPHSISILGHSSQQGTLGGIHPNVHFPGPGFSTGMTQAPSNFQLHD